MPIRTAQDSHGTHFDQFDAHAASASAVCAVCNAMPIKYIVNGGALQRYE